MIIAVLVQILLFVIGYAVISVLAPAPFLPCTYQAAQGFVAAAGVVLVFQLCFGARITPRFYKRLLVVDLAVLLLAVWLGSYPLSPLSYSNGRSSFLRGFLVTSASRGSRTIASGDVISLAGGSAVGISPILLDRGVHCDWSSANGGALDNSRDCDTFYVPPQSEHDLLKISVRPGCGLPSSIGEIKVSILP